MLNKIKHAMPIWLTAGVFCLLMPEISIGTVSDVAPIQAVVQSAQLKQKLELQDLQKKSCQAEAVCITDKMTGTHLSAPRTGMVMLLASLTVRP